MAATGTFSLGLLTLCFARGLPAVLAAQVLMGLVRSMLSGTRSALIYDTLAALGRTEEFRAREGKRSALSFYGLATAGALGGFLYGFHRELPVVLSLVSCAVAIAAVFSMRESERHAPTGRRHAVAEVVGCLRPSITDKGVLGVATTGSAALFATTKLMMWSQQPHYIALDLPTWTFGVLMSSGWVLGGLSSHFAHRLDQRLPTVGVVVGAGVVAGCCAAVAGCSMGIPGVVALMFSGSCLFGFVSPRISEVVNKAVDSSNRATMLSTVSFTSSFVFVPLSMAAGFAPDRDGIGAVLTALPVWLMAVAAILWLLKRRAARV